MKFVCQVLSLIFLLSLTACEEQNLGSLVMTIEAPTNTPAPPTATVPWSGTAIAYLPSIAYGARPAGPAATARPGMASTTLQPAARPGGVVPTRTPTPRATATATLTPTYRPTRPWPTPTPTASVTPLPTAAPTPTPSLTPLAVARVCKGPTQGERMFASPNGEYQAGEAGTVIAAADGRCARLDYADSVSFRGWTADSRFALWEVYDRYSNSIALGFDSKAWAQFALGQSSALGDPLGRGHAGPVALARTSRRVLLGNGELIGLPDTSLGNILAGTDRKYIAVAGWSPDESHVVYVAYTDPAGGASTLYLADGSETGGKPLAQLDWQSLSLVWSADSRSATLTTNNGRYVIDTAADRVEVLLTPTPKSEAASPAPAAASTTAPF